ncbi:PEP-CTERM protein-sorting domain-containing protein [Rubritalea squalenifaciens DSM 18772]|uniref:PEP-CTERM protein-sorting domain-containing protein n=1 Tax=Rubritalea squalenifaciens DSM 18772 TaxID=1123071 RepID=A0A1M6GRN8_9BACT|nr:PEP-CTERM sorting domain-containing protein [Rubritalea squalenifaciens]SHJ12568.1 PEP-CTERM protein-sorting domain-containing protein [Rubritalea squalenifaciens DSM 18772]
MKAKTALNGIIASAPLVFASAASAVVVNFSFSPFEYDYPDASDLDPIVISGTLVGDEDVASGPVSITVTNNSIPGDDWITSDAPTITLIAFDGDILPAPDSWTGSDPSVDFELDGMNLPGGNNLTPDFNSDFGLGAAPPPAHTGLDPGETLTINFTGSFDDIYEALYNGDLRIGLHVQQIGDDFGNSASYINDTPPPPPDDEIPEPSSGVLVLLTSLGFLIRRRR